MWRPKLLQTFMKTALRNFLFFFFFYEHPNFTYREDSTDAELLRHEPRKGTENRQTEKNLRESNRILVQLFLAKHQRPCFIFNRFSVDLVPQSFNKFDRQGRI
jgi:hypothetical protein